MEPNNYPALDKRFTLTAAEEEAYQQLLSRQEKGEELNPGEWEAFDALAARRRRRTDLDEFREAGKIGSLGDWVGVPAERNEQTNLPAKIRLYQQGKQHRTSPASLKAFANDELARQPDLKIKAIREANLYYGSDADKYQIQLDFIEQVYTRFYEYVERDLAKLAGGTAMLPVAAAHSNMAVDDRESDIWNERLTGLLHFDVQPHEIADLVLNSLFKPKPKQSEPVPLANTGLFALCDALKLRKIITLPVPEFAKLIGTICGLTPGKRLYGKGAAYEDFFEPFKDATLSMKTAGQARLKSHQKPS